MLFRSNRYGQWLVYIAIQADFIGQREIKEKYVSFWMSQISHTLIDIVIQQSGSSDNVLLVPYAFRGALSVTADRFMPVATSRTSALQLLEKSRGTGPTRYICVI